jgi:hypothetical protein
LVVFQELVISVLGVGQPTELKVALGAKEQCIVDNRFFLLFVLLNDGMKRLAGLGIFLILIKLVGGLEFIEPYRRVALDFVLRLLD